MRVLVAEDDPLIALGLVRAPALARTRADRAGRRRRAGGRARTREPARPVPVRRRDAERRRPARPPTQLAGDGLRRPVVVVTGVDDPGLIERSIASGVSAYLTKPVDTRELEAAIELAGRTPRRVSGARGRGRSGAAGARGPQARRARKGAVDVGARPLRAGRVPPAAADRARAQPAPRRRGRRIVEQQSLLEPTRHAASSSANTRPTNASTVRQLPGRSCYLDSCGIRDDVARGQGSPLPCTSTGKARAMASNRSQRSENCSALAQRGLLGTRRRRSLRVALDALPSHHLDTRLARVRVPTNS